MCKYYEEPLTIDDMLSISKNNVEEIDKKLIEIRIKHPPCDVDEEINAFRKEINATMDSTLTKLTSCFSKKEIENYRVCIIKSDKTTNDYTL